MHGVALVTGATGFAGSHLLDRLVAGGVDVHALARTGGAPPIDGMAVRWWDADVTRAGSVEGVLRAARPSVVYHLAGHANVADAWQDSAAALRTNALGTHHLLRAIEAVGTDCRVVVAGSALVYRPQPDPLDEESPIGPDTPYGVSKLAQEMTAVASALPVVLARPFNHAGPRQSPSFSTAGFAQQIARIEAGRAEPVLRVGNLDARRDVTDVRDTVRAYQLLAERGVPRRPYNVCSGLAYTVQQLLETLLSLARVRVRIEVDPGRLRPSDTPVIVGSHARLTADTGWQPEIAIERTMADLLDYWRAREARTA